MDQDAVAAMIGQRMRESMERETMRALGMDPDLSARGEVLTKSTVDRLVAQSEGYAAPEPTTLMEAVRTIALMHGHRMSRIQERGPEDMRCDWTSCQAFGCTCFALRQHAEDKVVTQGYDVECPNDTLGIAGLRKPLNRGA